VGRIDEERCGVYLRYSEGTVRVLKTGIRIQGVEVTDSIWLTCCALHNLFLEQDGLNKEWENGTSIWVGPSGEHDEEEVRRYAPRHLVDNNTNPTQLDLTGMGPGTDDPWPVYENNNDDNDNNDDESDDSDSGTESLNDNINNNFNINNNNEYNFNNENIYIEPLVDTGSVDNTLGAIDVNDLEMILIITRGKLLGPIFTSIEHFIHIIYL
jgi:hypothetical protein